MLYETIEFRKKYTNIDEVLHWVIEQAKAGIPYCEEKFPPFADPAQMYYYFRDRVTFHNDPPGIELIQSPGTMFEDNYFGIPGAGDCDCFVTLLLSACWANGWDRTAILLYGRSNRHPSHISMCVIYDGEPYYMDLTEKKFNVERNYPYRQKLPVY